MSKNRAGQPWARLGNERRESVPDMRHARPYFELDLAPCLPHAIGHAHRVVAKHLVAADLN